MHTDYANHKLLVRICSNIELLYPWYFFNVHVRLNIIYTKCKKIYCCTSLNLWQILHCALGLVRSSVVLTAFQVFSRVFLTWAITYSVPSVSLMITFINGLFYFFVHYSTCIRDISYWWLSYLSYLRYLESLHVLLKTVPCQVCLFLSTGLIIYWDCIGTLTENILLFIRLPK